MAFENLDHVLYMQIRVSNLYRNAHMMSVDDFLILDKKTGFLQFVADAFEPFCHTGDLGILDEVNEYVETVLAATQDTF